MRKYYLMSHPLLTIERLQTVLDARKRVMVSFILTAIQIPLIKGRKIVFC